MAKGLLYPAGSLYRWFGPLWRWEATASDADCKVIESGSGWALSREGAEVGRDMWLTNVGSATFS